MRPGIKASAVILALSAIRGAYAADAAVSEADARATAIKAFPGKVMDGALGKGKVGSGLYYSF